MAIDTVTVACKLPTGLIATICEPATIMDAPQGKTAIAGAVKQEILFAGPGPQRRLESGGSVLGEHPLVVGGFGLTPNVPKAFWDEWVEQNKSYGPLKSGFIFALGGDGARREALNRRDHKSGFEPIDTPTSKKDGVEPLVKD
jgi:hypothetical protein